MTTSNDLQYRSHHRPPRFRKHGDDAIEISLPPHQNSSSPSSPRNMAKQGLRIGRTAVGKGVFTTKRIVDGCCIGEIRGLVIADDEYVSRYAFDLDDGRQLEPEAPFRFVNHSCEPNCAFQNFAFPVGGTSTPKPTGKPSQRLLLFSICDISIGQELTIDYNWPAIFAIPCGCRTPGCRGWIVTPKDLPQLLASL